VRVLRYWATRSANMGILGAPQANHRNREGDSGIGAVPCIT